jgi:hypothetical protein
MDDLTIEHKHFIDAVCGSRKDKKTAMIEYFDGKFPVTLKYGEHPVMEDIQMLKLWAGITLRNICDKSGDIVHHAGQTCGATPDGAMGVIKSFALSALGSAVESRVHDTTTGVTVVISRTNM